MNIKEDEECLTKLKERLTKQELIQLEKLPKTTQTLIAEVMEHHNKLSLSEAIEAVDESMF